MPQHLRSEFYDRIKKSKSYSSQIEKVDPSKSFTKAITELANKNSEISKSDLETYLTKTVIPRRISCTVSESLK